MLTHSIFAQELPNTAKLPVNLLLGLAPFATHPTTFPTSFNGIGAAGVVSVAPFPSLTEALEAGYLSQGQASMIWLGYKHYFSGAFQYTSGEGSSFERGRYRGLFFEAAPVLYNLVSTDLVTEKITTYKGFGATFQVGFEQPFWSHVFVSGRAGYLNSISTAGYYGFYTLILIGLPFSF